MYPVSDQLVKNKVIHKYDAKNYKNIISYK